MKLYVLKHWEDLYGAFSSIEKAQAHWLTHFKGFPDTGRREGVTVIEMCLDDGDLIRVVGYLIDDGEGGAVGFVKNEEP